MEPFVDIEFDCLPLRLVGRVDVPLDASFAFRARLEHLQRAIDKHGASNGYFLYNTRCVYRLANSDIENMARFTFEGTVVTDLSDRQAEQADLDVELVAETCGGLPPAVLAWFQQAVKRAVLIEFDRFIAAGSLADRVTELGQLSSLAGLAGFAGADV